MATSSYLERSFVRTLPVEEQASACEILSFYENVMFWIMTPIIMGLALGVLIGALASLYFTGVVAVVVFCLMMAIGSGLAYWFVHKLCFRSFQKSLRKVKNMLEKNPHAVSALTSLRENNPYLDSVFTKNNL